ncbi:DUF5681 domain-containing protein [Nitrosococcus wardiae]|uniref:DUF5681 domain-containing protein n=1 Tax=Nitrosococcus wardiae TaxID=1814290 RepID=A0A4P7BVC0_9GAMM|nr:DUF5681 domain-containing protein [Nitrosococcus wardiae]QBQ53831.1 hypothetical protein E3U44_04370 [Nitrosococcus wardiae]
MRKRPPTRGSFKPGGSGNPKGKPKGARNKLGEAFLCDLYADWQEHGRAVLSTVREQDPAAYLRIVASLLPREAQHHHFLDELQELSTEELRQKLEQVRQERIRLEGSDEEPRH